MTNGFEVYENEEYLESNSDPVIKEEPLSDEEAPTDLPRHCILCAKQFKTLSGLKAHVIAHHNYKSVKRKSSGSASPAKGNALSSAHSGTTVVTKYVCDICKRTFTTSTDLKVHEVCHDKFSCFACDAKLDSFDEVWRHRRWCKVARKEVKPKTLRDILNERLAQKQTIEPSREVSAAEKIHNTEITPLNTQLKSDKDNRKEKVEIEINIKKELLDESEKADNEIKIKSEVDNNKIKIKSEVDYNKIETELEGMFKNVFDEPHATSTEQKEKKSDSNEIPKDKENGSQKNRDTIDDKNTSSKEEQVLNATIVREHKNLNNKITESEDSKVIREKTVENMIDTMSDMDQKNKEDQVLNATIDEEHKNLKNTKTRSVDSKDIIEETVKSIMTNTNMEIRNNDDLEQKLQIAENNSSELKNPVEDNKMEVDTSDISNKNENIDINNTSKLSNCKASVEMCGNSQVIEKTDLFKESKKEIDKDV